jgi:hypothetical protein
LCRVGQLGKHFIDAIESIVVEVPIVGDVEIGLLARRGLRVVRAPADVFRWNISPTVSRERII